MSDLRQDPVTGQWVVISELRAIRPNEFRQVETRRSDLACPFCAGFEHQTPAALDEVTRKGESSTDESWLIRVVPNKYPALTETAQTADASGGPYQSASLPGHQEIVIQSPRHVASFSQLTDEELDASLQIFRKRVEFVQQLPAIEHVMLFTNCRSDAGASLEHIHSQIIGTPIISPNLETRHQLAEAHLESNNKAMMECIVSWELDQAQRIVASEDSWVVFCPFASRFPYQVWIAPRHPESDFVRCDEKSLNQLGRMIREVVDRLERVHDFPAYNIMFHSGAHRQNRWNGYQWYVEIVPRLTRFAGYELGTGCWINHVSPDEAARQLRQLPSNFATAESVG